MDITEMHRMYRTAPISTSSCQKGYYASKLKYVSPLTLLPVMADGCSARLWLATCGNPSYKSLDKLLMLTRID